MKSVLILGAGGYQYTAVEKAKKLGFKTVVVSNIVNDMAFTIADERVLCSTVDIEEVIKVAKKWRVDGVFTIASEIASQTAAVVAEELGLNWQKQTTVRQISDKQQLNKLLNKKKVAVNSVQFPVVVKPRLASGSSGLTKVCLETELKAAIQKAKEKSFINEGYVIEPFYEGKHYSAVVVLVNGKIDFLFTSLKIQDQSFCTLAHLTIELSNETRLKVIAQLADLFEKLEVKEGFFDVDLVITNSLEVVIIELGSRLGGNGLAELVEHATGYDVISSALQYSVGIDIVVPVLHLNTCAASVVLKSDIDGVFDQLNTDMTHLNCRLFVKKGEQVKAFKSGKDQFGVAFVKAANVQELEKEVNRVLNLQHCIV